MPVPDGYITDPGFDPAEDHIGPFYYRDTNGGFAFAFEADGRHCNVTGIVHGGVLMTFADFSACIEATAHYKDENCVTVSMNCEFISAGARGDLIESRTKLTKKTGSMAFVTGEVFSGDEILLTFSSVIKRLRKD